MHPNSHTLQQPCPTLSHHQPSPTLSHAIHMRAPQRALTSAMMACRRPLAASLPDDATVTAPSVDATRDSSRINRSSSDIWARPCRGGEAGAVATQHA
eukprot:364003-Chlamydomonas_euryale.AAC.43